MAETAFTWGNAGEKLTPSERRRKVAEAMILRGTSTAPIQHWTQGAARVAEALMGQYDSNQMDKADKAGQASVAADAASLMGGGSPAAPAVASSAGGGAVAAPNVTPDIKDGIVQTAAAIGADPVDLATAISYETGGTFDPTKAGPRTKWGQHRGLIQFGEPQAKQHGVDWSNPVGSQLGPNGAVASYMKASGYKPGMNFMDLYSTINAGAPGLYNRSDAAAGGAPGTVRDKVEQQMQGHRAKAEALLRSAQADMPAPDAMQAEAPIAPAGFAVPPGEPAAPAMTAQNFNAIQGGQPLDPAFQAEGTTQPWMGTAIPPQAPPMVAQAPTPMPPPRPADLPAPGAVEAIGQMPPQAVPQPQMMPDLSNSPDGGMRQLQMQAEQARQSQPAAPQEAMNPLARVAAAFTGGGQQAAPAAAPSPAVANVAQAVGSPAAPASPGVDRVASAMRVLNSPYAQPGQRAIAQMVVAQAFKDPTETEARRLDLELKRKSLAGDPLDREGKQLDIDKKRREAGEIKPPQTLKVKQADQSEVTLEWDPKAGTYVPLRAPLGGTAVGPTSGNPYALPGKPTEDQSKSAGFANRMAEAHAILDPIEDIGIDKTQAGLNNLPFGLNNMVISKDRQKYNQAKENFITAQLRKESGAVIGDDEFKREERKYFPVPGEGPEIIAQKRQSRITALKSMMGSAGSGYKLPDGVNFGDKKPKETKQDGPPAPTGVDANVWKHMTPEERALWK